MQNVKRSGEINVESITSLLSAGSDKRRPQLQENLISLGGSLLIFICAENLFTPGHLE